MSRPQRYSAAGDEVVMADSEGPLVKWEDYQRLDALCKQLMAQHSDISCENIMLRKAGDAMAVMVGHIEITGDAHRMMLELSKDWNAAKEGKPHA